MRRCRGARQLKLPQGLAVHDPTFIHPGSPLRLTALPLEPLLSTGAATEGGFASRRSRVRPPSSAYTVSHDFAGFWLYDGVCVLLRFTWR